MHLTPTDDSESENLHTRKQEDASNEDDSEVREGIIVLHANKEEVNVSGTPEGHTHRSSCTDHESSLRSVSESDNDMRMDTNSRGGSKGETQNLNRVGEGENSTQNQEDGNIDAMPAMVENSVHGGVLGGEHQTQNQNDVSSTQPGSSAQRSAGEDAQVHQIERQNEVHQTQTQTVSNEHTAHAPMHTSGDDNSPALQCDVPGVHKHGDNSTVGMEIGAQTQDNCTPESNAQDAHASDDKHLAAVHNNDVAVVTHHSMEAQKDDSVAERSNNEVVHGNKGEVKVEMHAHAHAHTDTSSSAERGIDAQGTNHNNTSTREADKSAHTHDKHAHAMPADNAAASAGQKLESGGQTPEQQGSNASSSLRARSWQDLLSQEDDDVDDATVDGSHTGVGPEESRKHAGVEGAAGSPCTQASHLSSANGELQEEDEYPDVHPPPQNTGDHQRDYADEKPAEGCPSLKLPSVDSYVSPKEEHEIFGNLAKELLEYVESWPAARGHAPEGVRVPRNEQTAKDYMYVFERWLVRTWKVRVRMHVYNCV
jgi:hypothetical protein